MRFIATCPDETKDVLAGELSRLSARELRPVYRGVGFEADLEVAYRAHLWLRTASRIQRIVAELPAETAAALAQAAASIPWTDFVLARHAFAVSAILADKDARAIGEAPVQEAIASAVAKATGAPYRPEAEEPVGVVAHVKAGICTVGLDTAGRALHKRGWRLPGHPAVLKETLAASLLLLAGYDGSEPLIDPMCGSGTIAIEAAYIAMNKAPLIHRGKDDFGFERQAGFDRALWRRVSDQARAAKLPAPRAPVFAGDIRADFVELARKTALRARVEKHMSFFVSPLQQLVAPAPRGLLIANLPYGERISAQPGLYADVGRALRGPFATWRAALLVPAGAPLAAFDLPRPSQSFALMNGALEVRLLVFERR
jgi:putative N6-adenine-specific DNA methylase